MMETLLMHFQVVKSATIPDAYPGFKIVLLRVEQHQSINDNIRNDDDTQMMTTTNSFSPSTIRACIRVRYKKNRCFFRPARSPWNNRSATM